MYGPERLQLFLKRCGTADEVQRDWGSNYPDMNGSTFVSSERNLYQGLEAIEGDHRVPCVKDHLACIVEQDLLCSAAKIVRPRNPTRLSDDFFKTITLPIFLIRHPLLMVRSFWETQLTVYKMQPEDDLFRAMTTLRWTAMLYDWFMQQGIQPVVIDGHDIVRKTKSVMERVCSTAGIDPEQIVYEWLAEEEVDFTDNHMRRVFMGKLQQTTGVRQDLTKDVEIMTLETQTEMWRSQWGEDVAEKLKIRVEEELPFYERLRSLGI